MTQLCRHQRQRHQQHQNRRRCRGRREHGLSHSGPLLLLLSILLMLATHPRTTAAQLGPDPRWLNPNGSFPDFRSTYVLTDTVPLAWDALNASVSDLWLTSENTTSNAFAALVTAGVDIAVAGGFKWAVNETVTPADVRQDNLYVLRFVAAGVKYYALDSDQLASPGIVLKVRNRAAAATSSSSLTVIATASATPTTTPTPTTTGAVASSTSAAAENAPVQGNSSGRGLSGGADAGIAAGVVVAVIAALAVAYLSWQRRRRGKRTAGTEDGQYEAVFGEPGLLRVKMGKPGELPGNSPQAAKEMTAMMDGATDAQRLQEIGASREVYEMTATDFGGSELSGSTFR